MEKRVEVTEVDDSDGVEIVENPVRKVRHVEEIVALPRWGWHEQPTTDYAKEFVAIFRGM
jgi:hypothetical protein